jgi:adenylosuccinate synthase
MKTITVCTGYELNGKIIDEPPNELHKVEKLKPIYQQLEGFNTDISHCRTFYDLPESVRKYMEFIEIQVDCPIELISVGPDRDQTITLVNPF